MGVTPCLGSCVEGAQTQENSGLERETGLEPATPCLEGRDSTSTLEQHCR